MKVIGIDPGFAHLGWAVASLDGLRPSIVASGHITTPPEWQWAERLAEIGRAVHRIVADLAVDAIAIEDVTGAIRGAQRERGATTSDRRLQVTGDGWILVAGTLDLPYAFVLPSQWRSAVGCGARASKEDVREALVRVAGLRPGAALHTSDAAAIAIAGGRRLKAEIAAGMWSGGTRIVRLPVERAARARAAAAQKQLKLGLPKSAAPKSSTRKRRAA